MSQPLRVLLRAELDIDEIMDWIADRDERAALRFQACVRETLGRIEQFPNLSSELVTPRGKRLRITAVKRYRRFVVIYRMTESEIEVLRVIRGSRNLDRLLDE